MDTTQQNKEDLLGKPFPIDIPLRPSVFNKKQFIAILIVVVVAELISSAVRDWLTQMYIPLQGSFWGELLQLCIYAILAVPGIWWIQKKLK